MPLVLVASAAVLALLALAGPAAAATGAGQQAAAQTADVSTHASPGLIAVVFAMTLALFVAGGSMVLRRHPS
jgi:hypothetical protein